MKTSSLFLAILFIACKAAQPDALCAQSVNSKLANPPGTVWLSDSTYMDETEVSNMFYCEYLSWLKKNEPSNYEAALPDTTVWREKQNYNEPYVQYYLRHPAYWDYPVVGVSYEQAMAYCKWRTARVKEYTKVNGKEKSKKYGLYANVEYRLPTKTEWEYAASGGNMEANTGFVKLVGTDNKPKVWVRESWVLYAAETNGNDIYTSVKKNGRNGSGFYNMIGNISEMIMDKGVAKGGSVFNSLDECFIDKETTYSKPSARVGFRCICVVRK